MVTRTRMVRWIGLLGAAALLGGVAEAQRRQRPETASSRERMREERERKKVRPGPLIGRKASDFTLPLLVEEKNDKGEKVKRISDKKVTLSDFRGKKVVCIFFFCYT